MPTYKIVLMYDGTSYIGWQVQPNGVSIQEKLEAGLTVLFREPIKTVAAGRTDAGVHALGQVASFKASAYLNPRDIVQSLNGIVPADIFVRSAEIVPDSFHARYDAVERRYRYKIVRLHDVFQRFFAWHVSYALNIDLLHECAGTILGEHDFSGFSKLGTPTKHRRCTVRRSAWEINESEYVYVIWADRFLRGMVRLLVGTMIDVARGYMPLGDFLDVLESGNLTKAGGAAPAHGLYLEEVLY